MASVLWHGVLHPPSNSWIVSIICLYEVIHMTPTSDSSSSGCWFKPLGCRMIGLRV